ncbi:MAG: filamentous hemagglutinin N-terminal domain-containing protein, partial [Elusimicrobia bacterium]|nr:filamentous hemagglutinin N-terminal domain-containing protein [Elusimicrobiota bacterium]
MKKVTKSPLTVLLAVAVFLNYSGFGYAQALPELTNVTEGSITTNQPNATTLDINVHQNRSVGEYASFNVGSGYTANVNHDVAGWSSLHRVTGDVRSDIMGNLTSNGQVFLINPNGILFGVGAVLDMPGLVASTLNISDADFVSGNLAFQGASGSIENRGRISIRNGGYAVLLAPEVRNSGAIVADLGKAALVSGEAVALNLDDNGDISVVVSEGVQGDLKGGAAIENTGTIQAQKVILTAKSLNKVFDQAVNNTGLIQAGSLVSDNGVIELVAEGAAVQNSGTISGKAVSISVADSALINNGAIISNGGLIDVAAKNIINAGRIAANALERARAGIINLIAREFNIAKSGSSVEARATGLDGQGGSVTFRADNGATIIEEGAVVDVSGGLASGDAGSIELSAGEELGIYSTNVGGNAAAGYKKAAILLDPRDIKIQDGGAGAPTNDWDDLVTADEAYADHGILDLLIDADVLVAMISDEIWLQATRDILLLEDLDLSTNSNAVRFEADRHIRINANLTTNNRDIRLTADASPDGIGNIQMSGSINSNGGDIFLEGAGVQLGSVDAGAGDVAVTTTWLATDINDDGNNLTVVSADTLTLNSADEIGTNLNRLDTSVNTLNATAASGSVYLENDKALTVSSVNVGADVNLTTLLGDLSVDSIIAGDDVVLT